MRSVLSQFFWRKVVPCDLISQCLTRHWGPEKAGLLLHSSGPTQCTQKLLYCSLKHDRVSLRISSGFPLLGPPWSSGRVVFFLVFLACSATLKEVCLCDCSLERCSSCFSFRPLILLVSYVDAILFAAAFYRDHALTWNCRGCWRVQRILSESPMPPKATIWDEGMQINTKFPFSFSPGKALLPPQLSLPHSVKGIRNWLIEILLFDFSLKSSISLGSSATALGLITCVERGRKCVRKDTELAGNLM